MREYPVIIGFTNDTKARLLRGKDFDTRFDGFMQFCIRIGNRLYEISIANRQNGAEQRSCITITLICRVV